MTIDPAVQLAIVAAVNGLFMYWLQHTLAKKYEDNHADTKVRIALLDDKVDGKLTKLLDTKDEQSKLNVELAEVKAMAIGQEKGEAKATLAALQHDAAASARALPPGDEKLVNGGKVQVPKNPVE